MHANAQTENSSCRSQEVHIQNNIFTNAGGESVSFMRKADYIGSFLVTGSAHLERADIVRQKLEAARAYTQSKPILLAISLHGIKVCDENGSSVHMAHTLRRISYATCDPDSCQFAFLAREPKAQPNIQYCHAFVTKTPQEAESLNTLVGEAFRIAYAQQRALIESRRRSSNNQTQTASAAAAAAAAVAKEIAPPVATNPVPEPGDSGIATTEDSASLHRRSCSGKAELMGYHMAADSGLSSAESASRGVKPCFSDTDEVDPGDSDVDEKEKGKRQGETRLENEQDGNAEYDCGQLQPRCRQPFKDTATPTLEKNGKSSRHQRSNGNIPPRRSIRGRVSPHLAGGAPAFSGDLEAMALGLEARSGGLEPISHPIHHSHRHQHQREHPSAPHPTPLPLVTRSGLNDAEETELANSLSGITGAGGRYRPTPFSSSACSVNNYDQASSHSNAHGLAPGHGSVSAGSGSSGGANSLKTSPGGLLSTSASSSHHPLPSLSHHHHPHHHSELQQQQQQHVNAPWYQPHIPRELALDMLSRQPPGSFVVRDSGTHSNCYALSVRVGNDGNFGSSSGPERCMSAVTASDSTSNGGVGGSISHYLIQRTPTGGVRLKGLEKEWPSLPCLILHLTVMPEMLPCPLRDPSASSSHHNHEADNEFRPISAAEVSPSAPPPSQPAPTSEYQQLSEFSSLLADLNPPREVRRRQRRQPPPPPPPARIR